MSNHNNYLSGPKPLNWQEPNFDSIVEFPKENPPLVLGKALTVPLNTPGPNAKPQLPRKRDATGKFAESSGGATQTTAEQDRAKAEREEKLAFRKIKEKFIGKALNDRNMAPKSPQFNETQDTNPTEQPIGQGPSGVSIFDDPYHESHEMLSPEDHVAAADMHLDAAREALMAGDHAEAFLRQQKAAIHQGLSSDFAQPSERAVQTLGMDKLMQYAGNPQQSKPNLAQLGQGPKPGMYDTRTNSPVGPQTDKTGHGPMTLKPQAMPPEPTDGSSMPDIQGEGMNRQEDNHAEPDGDEGLVFVKPSEQDEVSPSPDTEDEVDEKMDEDRPKKNPFTKSLAVWLSYHK